MSPSSSTVKRKGGVVNKLGLASSRGFLKDGNVDVCGDSRPSASYLKALPRRNRENCDFNLSGQEVGVGGRGGGYLLLPITSIRIYPASYSFKVPWWLSSHR